MKDLKYIAKVEGISTDILIEEINDFINSVLPKNEYIIDVRIVKVGEIEYPPDIRDIKEKEYNLIAMLYIGEE